MNRYPVVLSCLLCLSPVAAALAQGEAPVKLPSLVVTDEADGQEPAWLELQAEQALTPGGVSLLDSETLFQRNVASLADMVRYVPGVWAASGSTGDGAFFSARGSNLDAANYDGNGIKLLQDGLPITAADGNNHNRTVDPLATRYAVIARGANALTYGASTLGGAINFITPTARDLPAVDLFLSGGSFGQVQGRATVGKVAGAFDGLVTVEARQYEGYRDDQHEQDRQSVYANAGWQFSETVNTRLYLSWIDNDQELPGALTRAQWEEDPDQPNPDNQAHNFLHEVETWRVASQTVWNIDANRRLSVGVSFEQQALYHPIVWSPFFSLLIDTEQSTAGTALRYHWRLGTHELLAGLNYGQTGVEGGNYTHTEGRRDELSTRVDNDADSLELFLVDRWQFAPKWTAVYGAQGVIASREVENVTVSNGAVRNPRADFDSLNPRLGLIHQLTPDIELFGNVSRLYEAPTLYELEDDARGNEETLDAMHGVVAEIGTRGRAALSARSSWRWDVALYYARLQDEILSMDDPDAPGTSLAINVDDTIHAGVEALVGASLAWGTDGRHRLEPLVNLMLNHFKFDDDVNYDDNDLPAAPDYAIRCELLYRHASGAFAGPTFDFVGARHADFSNTYTVDAYSLLGLRAGYVARNWELFAELRNLTDKEYISLFSVRNAAAASDAILTPGEPRSLWAGLRLRF